MKGFGSILMILSFLIGALDILEIVALASWVWGAITIACIVGVVLLIVG